MKMLLSKRKKQERKEAHGDANPLEVSISMSGSRNGIQVVDDVAAPPPMIEDKTPGSSSSSSSSSSKWSRGR